MAESYIEMMEEIRDYMRVKMTEQLDGYLSPGDAIVVCLCSECGATHFAIFCDEDWNDGCNPWSVLCPDCIGKKFDAGRPPEEVKRAVVRAAKKLSGEPPLSLVQKSNPFSTLCPCGHRKGDKTYPHRTDCPEYRDPKKRKEEPQHCGNARLGCSGGPAFLAKGIGVAAPCSCICPACRPRG